MPAIFRAVPPSHLLRRRHADQREAVDQHLLDALAQAEARAPREPEPAVAPPPAEPAPRKPRYDFYTVLPGKEVLVPDSELAQKAREEAAQPPTATAPKERYVLQAGAFRDTRDAEALKARIALSGQVARVETAQIDGKPIYRVRLGPYATARELESAKQQLAGNGISQTIAVREPVQ